MSAKPHASQTTFQSNHMSAKPHFSQTHFSQTTCQPNYMSAKPHVSKFYVSKTTFQPNHMSAKPHSSQTTCQSNHYKPHVSQTTCQPLKSNIKCGNFLPYYRELSPRVQGHWLTPEKASHFFSSFLLTLCHMKMLPI